MIYLDYSATTPVATEVLDTFVKTSKNYIGNPNSLHTLGVKSKKLMDQATLQITQLLGVQKNELIYTSGATESNNLAIKGIVGKYPNRGKQIITTSLEHSSILEPLHQLENQGYHIRYVHLLQDGTVDLVHLKKLLEEEDTVLVSIAMTSSEVGILQPIEEIGEIIKEYPKCFFHSDITQALGKVPVSLQNVDLASFSAHKFYGLKGIGGLVKKEKVELKPLFDGGKSTTRYRSGTPALALITSLAKALRLSLETINVEYVKQLNDKIQMKLKEILDVHINSTSQSIPHILNISVHGVKPETLLHALEEKDIYISTMSACSSSQSESLAVKSVTHNTLDATTSIRISLSVHTTQEEVDTFLKVFKEVISKLRLRS
ncbi:MAG TPA: cysteine desulfurase [Candidatus Pelethosoma merdigallinarum]|nr:cysteine desulfurase [Candidatus Pelethosoma merdigallinarum]